MIRRLKLEKDALDLGLEGYLSFFFKLVSGLIGTVYSQGYALTGQHSFNTQVVSLYHAEPKCVDVEV